MAKIQYAIPEERRKEFAAIYLLQFMINKPASFSIILDGNTSFLEPILKQLTLKNYVAINNGRYVPTEAGRQCIQNFAARYSEYLQLYDIFCAVDLTAGKFAFGELDANNNLIEAPFLTYSNEELKLLLNQPNWEDLRVAVAQFKKIDPIEIIFMSFVMEDKFGFAASAQWEFDLVLGKIWDEIANIANTNLHICDLAYNTDDNLPVTGESVIEDIFRQGTALAIAIIKKGDEMRTEAEAAIMAADEEEIIEETIIEEETVEEYYVEPVAPLYYDPFYYDPYYYDPFYISPVWAVPLILLW